MQASVAVVGDVAAGRHLYPAPDSRRAGELAKAPPQFQWTGLFSLVNKIHAGPMNIRKGLIRFWIVLTVIWIMLGGGFAWMAWEKPHTVSLSVDQLKAIQRACERRLQDELEQSPDPKDLLWGVPCSSLAEMKLGQSKLNNEALFSAIKAVAAVFSIFLGVTAVFWALLYAGFWIASGFRGNR